MTTELPPYALIIAEVLDRRGGDVQIRLVADSGDPLVVWVDDSNTAPLQEQDAAEVSERWNIALPG